MLTKAVCLSARCPGPSVEGQSQASGSPFLGSRWVTWRATLGTTLQVGLLNSACGRKQGLELAWRLAASAGLPGRTRGESCKQVVLDSWWW